jgi:integrase/recombinase XerD
MTTTRKFHGPFALYLDRLLIEKRALGLKYGEEERLMHVFDELSLNFDCSNGLTKELVMAYVEKQSHWSQSAQERRAQMAKQIAVFLNRQGIPAYICDCKGITQVKSNFSPYIFTHRQIADIFDHVDNKLRSKENDWARLFYPVIFRMLYGCGLRISEALNLRMKDVDLSEGLLYIYNSKNHKDRVIPMDESLTEYCRKYAARIHAIYHEDDYFFQSPRGGKYNKGSVYHFFRMVLWEVGISHGGRSNGGPRLHDLRHTFCVHSFYRFMTKGVEHRTALPILSVYMGHSSIAATSRYLRLTAEAFPEITRQMEISFGHIIPEAEVSENEAD